MTTNHEDIETTAWANRFREACPTSYKEAIELARTLEYVVIQKRDDHSFQGDYIWAIVPDNDESFWLDALPTEPAARKVCREMGWRIEK